MESRRVLRLATVYHRDQRAKELFACLESLALAWEKPESSLEFVMVGCMLPAEVTPVQIAEKAARLPAKSLIVLPCDYSAEERKLLGDLGREHLSYRELREYLARIVIEDQPRSFQILRLLDEQRRQQPQQARPLIIALIDSPGIALTQELCRLGADWVWPYCWEEEGGRDMFAQVVGCLYQILGPRIWGPDSE